MSEAVPEASTTIPATSTTVDGGSATEAESQFAEAQKQARHWESSYKGMQTNYNRLHQEAQTKDAHIADLSSQISELQSQVESLTSEQSAAQQNQETTSTELDGVRGELNSTNAQLEMYKMITGEFSNLAGIAETLQPRDTVENTREMLQKMSEHVAGLVNAQVAQAMEGVVPSGNIARSASPQLTQEQLYDIAMSKAGTPEADQALEAYFQAVEASGKTTIPMPHPEPFEDML